MSIKKYIFLFFFITIAGFSIFNFFNSKKPIPRNFANYENSIFVNGGKGDRVIELKISTEPISSENDSTEVIAHVSVPFDFDGILNYKWTLGQNVQIIDGPLESQFSNLKRDQVYDLKILVTGFNKSENRHIGFSIYGTKNGRGISAKSLIASQIENTFENIVQNVERIKAEEKDK